MTATWPGAAGQPVVLITERLSPVERTVFDRWLERERPAESSAAVVHIPPQGRLDEQTRRAFGVQLARDDDPLLAPVRVFWRVAAGSPDPVSPITALITGDPRRPRPLAQPLLLRRDPGRAQVVVGRAALLSEVRARYAVQVGDDDPDRFAEYVSRHTTLALEQAVSQLLGPQYKIPRLVRQEIAASARFQDVVRALAEKLDRPFPAVKEEAESALDELATGWGRLLVDLQAQMGRAVYRLGYDEQIEYDDDQVERVREALNRNPGVLLMSHRSHLDGALVPVALADKGLPRAHLLAGINMSFFPIGMLFRRAGVIYIRREFRDDEVYKTVLRQYVGYLLEKRFHLQWSIEGTRSRTGKMEPPKLGLLSYVVDALREGRAADVVLVPVSIAYDQLHEVGEFASYASGAEKRPEGLRWMVRWLRGQRRGFGKIYISFAEPISVKAALGSLERPAPNELPKLAFEVAWRMNRATPITGAALVTSVLLGVGGRALTLSQVRDAVAVPLRYARDRNLPLAASARGLDSDDGLLAMLPALGKHDVVTCYRGGLEPVWMINPEAHHAASFYRNSLVHFFLDAALAELALMRAAETAPEDALDAFWQEAYALRDLLKFDFFFPDKDEFRAQLTHELSVQSPSWQEQLKAGDATTVLNSLPLLSAGVMLSSFVEAYVVVADVLQGLQEAAVDERALRRRCLSVGRQYLLQQRLQTSESVSTLLFRTGVQLAAHRGLLAGGDDVVARRRAFSAELRDVLRRAEQSRGRSQQGLAGLVRRTEGPGFGRTTRTFSHR
jgi:glycerol-3-phosphate O-acyltransferase